MCLWVDDMVILGLQEDFCEKFKNKISEQFQISSYGDLSWFLNIKIERTQKRNYAKPRSICRKITREV